MKIDPISKKQIEQLREQVKLQAAYIRFLEQGLSAAQDKEFNRKVEAGELDYAKGC
jgi:hypothetical protein